MVTISESGMKFGPFPDDIVYRIEKSNIYTSLGNSVKTVEFLYKAKTRKLFFIEAKSSSPRPDGERFVDYIDEISSKFIHSFHFWLTLKLNRRQDNISPELLDYALDSQIFQFVLVIKGHDEAWLPPIRAAIECRMIAERKIWGHQVIVINDQQARKKGWIQ